MSEKGREGGRGRERERERERERVNQDYYLSEIEDGASVTIQVEVTYAAYHH